jgi:hypothetical protein
MLFWNDLHHVCFSGISIHDEAHSRKAYMMKVFPENMHDEGHSRKAYMMRVIPEKHT